MHFLVKPFSELSVDELYALLRLRAEVFVVEQTCPYLDPDGKDKSALHVLAYTSDASEELIGYARIVEPGISYPEISIGRVVIAPLHRKSGLGRALMEFCLSACTENGRAMEIVISAQCYLQKFYEGLGFAWEGEEYLEDDIPHVKMRRKGV